jgi:serine/threonine-protein kinase
VWAPYFVLEWLDGESLADAMKVRRAQGFRGRPLAEVMRWLQRPAQALAYAHDRRVAHRDIKPANLFVVRSDPGSIPPIKILDFGIAKAMEQGPNDLGRALTKAGFSAFTPQYAAPEQFDPRIGPTGPWSDVYSFALVVVELLTDRLPVPGDDAISLMQSTLNPSARPTPRAKGLNVPESVERVFARALSIDPTLRFADAGGFWDALVAAESDANPRSQLAAPSEMTFPAVHPGLPTPASIQVSQGTLPTPYFAGTGVPTLAQSAGPPKRRVWAWVLFGIVLGIAMIFATGVLTCTTCVYSAF